MRTRDFKLAEQKLRTFSNLALQIYGNGFTKTIEEAMDLLIKNRDFKNKTINTAKVRKIG